MQPKTHNWKTFFKGFTTGVCAFGVMLVGIAASPTDTVVRGYLRALVDSTAAPPPLCQAMTGQFSTVIAATNNALTILQTTNVAASGRIDTVDLTATNSVKSSVGTFGTLSNSIFNSFSANILTGTFSLLLPASAVRTTNTFTVGTNVITIIKDALGIEVSFTVTAL